MLSDNIFFNFFVKQKPRSVHQASNAGKMCDPLLEQIQILRFEYIFRKLYLLDFAKGVNEDVYKLESLKWAHAHAHKDTLQCLN